MDRVASMDFITYICDEYPAYEAQGFAAQFAFPFAHQFCKGAGYDIGCNREEWAFPGAIPIDLNLGSNALQLPDRMVDYIFSSHCLEHLPDWVAALDHWGSRLRCGGTLFLYLPHFDQTYWRPWNNRKHIHVLTAEVITAYLQDRGYKKIMSSGMDLNHSFVVVAENT